VIIIGIDPGLSGGIALYDTKYNTWIVYVMPVEKKTGIHVAEIHARFCSYIHDWSDTLAVIEKVHAMPGQGVTSMFTFGMGYGKVIGLLETLEIPYLNPTPQQWKKRILEGTTKDKDATIAYVKQRYPAISLLPTQRCTKPHDGMADAICLCEYGMKEVK